MTETEILLAIKSGAEVLLPAIENYDPKRLELQDLDRISVGNGICRNLATHEHPLSEISKAVSTLMRQAAQKFDWYSGAEGYPVPAPPDFWCAGDSAIRAEEYYDSSEDLYADPDQRRMRLELLREVIRIVDEKLSQD